MSMFVSGMLKPKDEQSPPGSQTKAQEMERLLGKYTNAFPVHIPAPGSNNQAQVSDVILLTGSTGRVGCHLLAQLVSHASVTKVYALNRKGCSDVKERQREAFRMWGLDAELADFAKVIFLEGDLSKVDLGLGEQIYAEVSPQSQNNSLTTQLDHDSMYSNRLRKRLPASFTMVCMLHLIRLYGVTNVHNQLGMLISTWHCPHLNRLSQAFTIWSLFPSARHI